MISAVMAFTSIRASISANSVEEFADDLAIIKQIPPSDRRFDDNLKAWIISNPENYANIPFIARALKDRSRQPALPLF